MKNIANLSNSEQKELFLATAGKMGISEAIVEKDFWVCFMLDHLFNDSKYKDYFVFKGGTSLSKAYHVIHRFSEDIDLILDWRKINFQTEQTWQERSKNQQDIFNKKMNQIAADFYKNEFVPNLNQEIKLKLGMDNLIRVNEFDPMIVEFVYPVNFDDNYLRSYIQLEIGPIAEWLPSHVVSIKPFTSEFYPDLFTQKETFVRTIDVERTFWEKITILHKISNFPENKKLPKRYARHLYDVFCMKNSEVKKLAFEKKELLQKDVIFKQKFYYSKSAHYESATLKNVCLIPNEKTMKELFDDYKETQNMIYNKIPSFEQIIACLKSLEEEIHNL